MCHPLLKLSVLNLLRLRLESEVQFGEHGVSICTAFFIFEVVVVEYTNNVFSECIACAVNHTFITSFESIKTYITISGRGQVSISGLVEVTYMQAIGTRFVSGSAFPSEVCIPAVFISVMVIFVAAHIFSSQYKIAKAVICTNVPDFFAINKNIAGRISFIICYICVNSTKFCFNTSNIQSVAIIKQIA